MLQRVLIIFCLFFAFSSCSKKEEVYTPTSIKDPFTLYQEGLDAFESFNYFLANKKFSEAELNFDNPIYAAKSAIMSSYSLYGINFYDEAEENLKRYLRKYPADKNVIYAHYLLSIIYFEQISDEKKDLKPLILAKEKIDYFIKEYPDSEYTIDLKFKKDLIRNQLAAKELYVAKYYISVQKWVPAITRLKNIVRDYETTVFIEEALHRLVEIHYHLGLEEEATKYASLLGYNYNSSEWFKQSYKIINKDYKISKLPETKKDDNFLDKIINLLY